MADKDKDDEKKAAEQEAKNRKEIAGESPDVKHFETLVAKLVERENPETGETETYEVMSDNLYPGEKLKREVVEEEQKAKREQARADNEQRAAKQRAETGAHTRTELAESATPDKK